MTTIRIIETRYDGYERLYLIELLKSNRRVWAYGIDYDSYIENGVSTEQFEIKKEPSFSIEWVADVKEDSFSNDELTQSIENSSHIYCKVTVSKVIDTDSFECFSESLGKIEIKLENGVDFIKIGSKLSFYGNLRVDFN